MASNFTGNPKNGSTHDQWLHSLWRETNITLTEHDRATQELNLLVMSARSQLDATKTEVDNVNSMKHDVETKMAEVEAALANALSEKENLSLKSKHATEELSVLRRQLRLLSSSLADAKRRLDDEKAAFQKELSEQGKRLQALVLQNNRALLI